MKPVKTMGYGNDWLLLGDYESFKVESEFDFECSELLTTGVRQLETIFNEEES